MARRRVSLVAGVRANFPSDDSENRHSYSVTGEMMMLRTLTILLALVVGLGEAQASKLALVIGNSRYEHTAPLPNPSHDADTFADFLADAGFTVTKIIDADRTEMTAALSAFSRALQPEDTALFYYAGHGMQMGGENYLVGTEAQLLSEFDVPSETVALSSIIEIMEARAKVSMLFIDACRNNPLAQHLAREATRAISNGLAPVQVKGDGTMVAFAATPGEVAYDGPDGNSPFTKALVTHLGTPGLEVGTAFKRVISEVRSATGDRQSPQLVSNLSTEIYFGVPGTAAPAVDVAALDYEKAEHLGTVRGYQLFLDKHPDGFFADLARAALELLLGGPTDPDLSPADTEARLALTKEVRREIQIALNQLGYGLGEPDGAFGQRSRRGIARYQNAVGLQETGYVSVPMLAKLGISQVTPEMSVISGAEAKRFEIGDLQGLETDQKLLNAIGCLSQYELKYGFFQGHVYIAVLTFGGDFQSSMTEATRCGGYLVSIGSKAENDFVFSLFADDERFSRGWEADNDTGYTRQGPFIGFYQGEGAREPAGGWTWASGEAVAFTNWEQGEPSNWGGHEDFAQFFAQNEPKPDPSNPHGIHRSTWGDMPSSGATGYIMEID